jgi:hypothetical protein
VLWLRVGLAVALAAAVAGAAAWFHRQGVGAERARWEQRAAEEQAAERSAYELELARANAAATDALADARAVEEQLTDLRKEIRRASSLPLVVERPRRSAQPGAHAAIDAAGAARQRAAGHAAGVGAAPGDPTAEQAAQAPGSVAAAEPVDGSDVDRRLTLGFVRLWNSALAGESLAAGACSADDPTAQACAADSGLTLVDALDNHAENAASCRIDRAQLARLIGLVAERE